MTHHHRVKYDQPGLGLSKATSRSADVDVATYIAGELGYSPDQIEWTEAACQPGDVPPGTVDMIVATYPSPTNARTSSTSPAPTTRPAGHHRPADNMDTKVRKTSKARCSARFRVAFRQQHVDSEENGGWASARSSGKPATTPNAWSCSPTVRWTLSPPANTILAGFADRTPMPTGW